MLWHVEHSRIFSLASRIALASAKASSGAARSRKNASRCAVFWPMPGRCFNTSMSRSTRSEEHTSELQSRLHLVCRLLLEKKKLQTSQDRSAFQVSCLNSDLSDHYSSFHLSTHALISCVLRYHPLQHVCPSPCLECDFLYT